MNIFNYKNVRLINADTLLDSNLTDKEFADLIITSPPYNVGISYNSNNDELNYEDYLDFSQKWMKKCFRWSKHQARFCLNIPLDKNKGGSRSVGADLTKIAQEVGWKYKSTIIWNEGNISRRTAWGSWKSASAPVVIAPVELIVVLYKGEWKKTTFDPFVGSGTTLIVASFNDRKAVGIEIDPTYFQLAKKRITAEIGSLV